VPRREEGGTVESEECGSGVVDEYGVAELAVVAAHFDCAVGSENVAILGFEL
jgi:hypothetical protein